MGMTFAIGYRGADRRHMRAVLAISFTLAGLVPSTGIQLEWESSSFDESLVARASRPPSEPMTSWGGIVVFDDVVTENERLELLAQVESGRGECVVNATLASKVFSILGWASTGVEDYDVPCRAASGDLDDHVDRSATGQMANASLVVYLADANATLNLKDGGVDKKVEVDVKAGRAVVFPGHLAHGIRGEGRRLMLGPMTLSRNGSLERVGAALFPASIDLATLDGTDGFVIKGVDASDLSGWSVAGAGDVNGDGIDDVIVGAVAADPDGKSGAGESYVVYGKSDDGFGASIDLATLDGSDGFVIKGVDASDNSGISVAAAGDVNGDGIDDVIIGAEDADLGGNSNAGESYVVFGRSGGGFGASIELATLDGTDGFVIEGVGAGDSSGHSVAGAGDVNGDGIDDVIIGAFGADPDGEISVGESYVVFGRDDDSFGASIDLATLDGTDGFVIKGVDAGDNSGISVAGAGDVNGDGIDDVIIGAFLADPDGDSNAGESYVVFGSDGGFGASIDLGMLDGTDGFVIKGVNANDWSGWSVAGAGDVNGDGIDDVIIGARLADPDGNSDAGESYVVFGRNDGGFGALIDLATLDGTDGFVIKGVDAGDYSSNSVAGAGDVNGDGIDDVIIGAYLADPDGRSDAGESYVVFGRDDGGSGGSIDLATLDGNDGFVIKGVDTGDWSGISVAGAGDVNGDGVDDVIIGARLADPDGDSSAGKSYVVFGRPLPPSSFPTPAPSSSPSLFPTMSLTTNFPTLAPSSSPSPFPTMSPTTNFPTPTPSAPSPFPTVTPTTNLPTLVPSSSPSPFPTMSPTTSLPTPVPSSSPSPFPTMSPTTNFPTVAPSSPSHFPTMSPTTEVTTLLSDVAELRSTLLGLFSNLTTQMNDLASQVNDQISDLASQVNDLASQNMAIRSDLASQDAKIEEINTQTSGNLTTQINDLALQVNDQNTAIRSDLASQDAKIEGINAQTLGVRDVVDTVEACTCPDPTFLPTSAPLMLPIPAPTLAPSISKLPTTTPSSQPAPMPTDQRCFKIVDGSPNQDNTQCLSVSGISDVGMPDVQDAVANDVQAAGSACCFDNMQSNDLAVNVMNGNCELVTYDVALGRCDALEGNYRLCTEDELFDEERAKGTGNLINRIPVWSGTPCDL